MVFQDYFMMMMSTMIMTSLRRQDKIQEPNGMRKIIKLNMSLMALHVVRNVVKNLQPQWVQRSTSEISMVLSHPSWSSAVFAESALNWEITLVIIYGPLITFLASETLLRHMEFWLTIILRKDHKYSLPFNIRRWKIKEVLWLVAIHCRIVHSLHLNILISWLFHLPYLADDLYSPYLERVKGRGWTCKICAKEDTNKSNMRLHIDANHINARYLCPFCQYVNKTEDSRRKHIVRVHNMNISCREIRDMHSST